MTETRNDPSPGDDKTARSTGKRTSPALFYRQVVNELRKVLWPTRPQLITYTTVTLVFVLIVGAYVFGLDSAFGALVIHLFG